MAYSQDREIRNVVLVGKTGNGKSATGNTLLGLGPRKYSTPGKNEGFRSGRSLAGVTRTTEKKQVVIKNQIFNVIDTPGLFDPTATLEHVSQEIVKCVQMAKEGVHAFLGVVSTWNRFTEEESRAFEVLQRLFGPKLLDYMILVFTLQSEDDFTDIEEFQNEYLSRAPKTLQDIVEKCQNRIVLVNNMTRDMEKKEQYAWDLQSSVADVLGNNRGQPYSNEYFEKMQDAERKRIEAERKAEELRKQHEYSKSQELQKLIDKDSLDFQKQMTKKIKAQLMQEVMKMMKTSKLPKEVECCSVM